jgi:hypothetical protein
VIESLLCKCKALNSDSRHTKKVKEKEKNVEDGSICYGLGINLPHPHPAKRAWSPASGANP